VFGPLVDRQRGGTTGGGSERTATADELVARFDRLRATLAGPANVQECVVYGKVTERDGELGGVDTDAGELRARLVDQDQSDALAVGSSVQVSVRSDAVTLHAPTDAPGADATSARNRFAGTVVAIDCGTAIGRVAVDVGVGDPLVALLTRESLDRLDLRPEVTVVASFKATATRAIAAER
jgi:molybdate transport system regulatory protein